ncbi:hypothetical protein BGZ58_008915 [Dissophora ornata]|nr:hypothetical protein BGZ58_008915 [Dissophora ornata]
MAPPKKASSTRAASFFQRGKKPTTSQRVLTTKKPTIPTPIASPKQQDQPQPSLEDQHQKPFKPDDDANKGDTDSPTSSSDLQEDDWADFNTEILNEIPSNDSWVSREVNGSTTKISMVSILPKFLTDFNSLPSAVLSKRSRSHLDVVNGIHQSDLSDEEKMLRQFDLASMYGPCIDLTRLERWERASLLGLNPPQNVKDMVLENDALNSPVFAGRV